MDKPKISISFAELTHTKFGIASNTFPLGLSYVASYALKQFQDKISVELFKYPKDLQKYLENNSPQVVCFSNFCWNKNLSYEFAKRIKQHSPKTITVFGGPNYPRDPERQQDFLLHHPYIDFYISLEGEQAFSEFLKTAFKLDFNIDAIKKTELNLPNCHFILDRKVVRGNFSTRMINLDEIPSPYLTGLNDKFFDDLLMPTVQTTRGCPFQCAYCQEGYNYWTKISRFSHERVKNEFEYIAQRAKVPNLFVVDSNFGMYEEDIETAKIISLSKEKYGYPNFLDLSTGKNQKERILKCITSLGADIILSASVQSTDPTVLKNIKRDNVSMEVMKQLAQESKKIGMNSYGEVILALPGDTKEAHFKSVFDMIDSGVNVLRIYQFFLLPGSEAFDKNTREKFEIESRFHVIPRCFGEYEVYGESFNTAEIGEICIANNTMTYDDYLTCRSLSLTVELFYNNGVFRELSDFMEYNNISPSTLMKNIHDRIQENPGKIKEIYEGFLKENKEDIWVKESELKEFLQQQSTITHLNSGEFGNNELFKYKSLAFFGKMKEMHEIAFDAARELLNPSDEIRNYLEELFQVSLYRKQNLLSFEKKRGKFHYDFLSDKPFLKPMHQGINIEFSHSDIQKEIISKYKRQYGSSVDGFGRILHKSNVNTLYKKAKYVDIVIKT